MTKRSIIEIGKFIGGDWYVSIPVLGREGYETANILCENEEEIWRYIAAYRMPQHVLNRIADLESKLEEDK